MNTFTIPGELPTMNEIVAASKKHWSSYANMKKDYTFLVYIHAQKLPNFNYVDVEITWYCKNKKKDKDNISGGGTKFILDGMVQAGVVGNDGWKNIGNITNHFEVDREFPRIEVRVVGS